jgi:hypothetical protein
MTVEQVLNAALARTMEYGVNFPTSRASLVRRISQRQMELFAIANQNNPDFFGTYATAGLGDGAADLADMAPPVYSADTVSRVEVANPGSSGYADGKEISLVSFDDEGSAFPPRATLRGMVIRGVGDDLSGVSSIRVYYSRFPQALGPTDTGVQLELPVQFQELLVIDLARTVLKRALTVGGDAAPARIQFLDEEEKDLLGSFVAHVMRRGGAQVQRFASRTSIAAP